jgi:hypothetical protein
VLTVIIHNQIEANAAPVFTAVVAQYPVIVTPWIAVSIPKLRRRPRISGLAA